MKYKVDYTNTFKKDIKRLKKRGYKINPLSIVINLLQNGEILPPQYYDHSLKGNWAGYRECHIAPDWLLVYRIFEDTLVLVLSRTGTHSDLDF